jgi:pimeloyl-ACP methyl ester carboxylesterase
MAHINGVDLYFEVHGSGDTVLLTHGSWGDATGWQAVVPGLVERYEVVIWDRRGHSRSSDGRGAGTIDDDAGDLAALIEYLDRQGAHVYGSSSGGAVVLKLLAARPDLVTSVAVHEPALPGLLDGISDEGTARVLGEMKRQLDKVGRLIDSGADETAAEYFVDNVAVGPGAWEQFPHEVRRTFIANAKTYAEELSDPTAFVVDTDTLAASDVPILVTLGTESPPLLLATTRELIRRIPSAHVATLEGSGHVPYRTHPDLWLETLIGFCQTITMSHTSKRATP